MNVVYHLSYALGLVFLVGETIKRGPGHFAVNASMLVGDYLGGAVLLLAALLWHKRHKLAPTLMSLPGPTCWARCSFRSLPIWKPGCAGRFDWTIHTDTSGRSP
jgi:hypothetical protein